MYILTRNVSNLSSAASNTGTFQWRLERWKQSFAISRSTVEWLFGAPFGPTSVNRGGGLLQSFAHGAFMNAAENIGYLGCFLLILLLVSPLFGKVEIQSAASKAHVTLIFVSIVYGLTYGIARPRFALLGIFVAYNAQSRILNKDSNLSKDMKIP